MLKQYVISDTHFGHGAVLRFSPETRGGFKTIQEHDEELVRRWNSVVKPKDTVWHLGDVFFGKDNHKILAHLNGYKRLVLGNHDVYPLEVYLTYFKKVYGSAVWGGCLLTHIPIHDTELRGYTLNIHGHIHDKKINDDRFKCVSAEHTNLTPILLTDACGIKTL